jgi:hypothetical protein
MSEECDLLHLPFFYVYSKEKKEMSLNHFLQVPLTDAQVQSFANAQGTLDHIENFSGTAIVQCDPTGPNITASLNGANVFQARAVERFAEISEPGLSSVVRCAEDSVETYLGGNLRNELVSNKFIMKDQLGAQRLVVGDLGVVVNNAFTLPTTAAGIGNVLTFVGGPGNDTDFLPFAATTPEFIANASDPSTEVTVAVSGEVTANVGAGKTVFSAAAVGPFASPGYTIVKAPAAAQPKLLLFDDGSLQLNVAGPNPNQVLVCTDGAGTAQWGVSARIQDPGDPNNSFVWCDSDNINVGTNYPTGQLLLGIQGVITPGQVLTATSSAGACSWATPSPGLFSQTGLQTVANTTVETTLLGAGVGTLTIPANTFTAGNSFTYRTGGVFRDNAGGTTFRFRLRNSGVLFDSGLLSLQNITTLTPWNIDVVFSYTGGTTMVTNFTFTYNNASDARGFTSQQVNATFNPTISNTLNFTVQWQVASANNTIQTNFGVVSKLY